MLQRAIPRFVRRLAIIGRGKEDTMGGNRGGEFDGRANGERRNVAAIWAPAGSKVEHGWRWQWHPSIHKPQLQLIHQTDQDHLAHSVQPKHSLLVASSFQKQF